MALDGCAVPFDQDKRLGYGDVEYLATFEHVVRPIIRSCAPDLIVSCIREALESRKEKKIGKKPKEEAYLLGGFVYN